MFSWATRNEKAWKPSECDTVTFVITTPSSSPSWSLRSSSTPPGSGRCRWGCERRRGGRRWSVLERSVEQRRVVDPRDTEQWTTCLTTSPLVTHYRRKLIFQTDIHKTKCFLNLLFNLVSVNVGSCWLITLWMCSSLWRERKTGPKQEKITDMRRTESSNFHPLDHRTPPAVQVLKDDLLSNFLWAAPTVNN